jgi:hypothetical protein
VIGRYVGSRTNGTGDKTRCPRVRMYQRLTIEASRSRKAYVVICLVHSMIRFYGLL